METKKYCCYQHTKFFGGCTRVATTTYKEKPYCWQHDPEKLAAKAKIKWEKRKIELATADRVYEEKIVRKNLFQKSGLSTITNEQIEKIIQLGGIEKILENLTPKNHEIQSC